MFGYVVDLGYMQQTLMALFFSVVFLSIIPPNERWCLNQFKMIEILVLANKPAFSSGFYTVVIKGTFVVVVVVVVVIEMLLQFS